MSGKNVTTITRDIDPGENFSHEGPVVIEGNVGDGATLNVAKGGVRVSGDVGDRVTVKTRAGKSSNFNNVSGISISGGDVVIVNGRVVSGNVSGGGNGGSDGPQGIEIAGRTGHNVTLDADNEIGITDAGDGLKADAGLGFTGGHIGNGAEIDSGNSLTFKTVGAKSELDAGNKVKCASRFGGRTATPEPAAREKQPEGDSPKHRPKKFGF